MSKTKTRSEIALQIATNGSHEITEAQFDTMTVGGKIIARNEGGFSVRVDRDLYAMIDTGDGFIFTGYPDFYALYSEDELP